MSVNILQEDGLHRIAGSGGNAEEIEQKLQELEALIEETKQLRADLETYGMVKLSNVNNVTDSTGLALPATEKNAHISGTLANEINLKLDGRVEKLFGNVDWNTVTNTGIYKIQECNMSDEFNAPKSVFQFGTLLVLSTNYDNEPRIVQVYFPNRESGEFRVFERVINNGTAFDWISFNGAKLS